MQMILLAGICIECMILLGLSFLKKLTKKIFWVTSIITFLCCLIGMIVVGNQKEKIEVVNQKEFVYMAARLLEEDYPAEALKALGQVIDERYNQYGVKTLRGLAHNQNEDFQIVEVYLKGTEEENELQLVQLSRKGEKASSDLIQDITEKTKSLLELSEQDMAQLDAEMKVRFLAEFQTIDETADAYIRAKAAIADSDYETAFETMINDTNNANTVNAVIISNMYINNYNLRSLGETDEEYDKLLQEVTEVQSRLNLASLENMSTNNTQSVTDNISEEQKDFAEVYAEYAVALDRLGEEAVRRAINYLESVKPNNGETDIAYQLQMSRLHYLVGDNEEARKQLAPIFEIDTIDTNQRMGLEVYLLKEAYLLMAAGETNSAEFSKLYNQMMNNLYLDLFTNETADGYQTFLEEYFRTLFSGLRIGQVDTTKYPKISIEVSSSINDFEFSNETIALTDTDSKVESFEIEEIEVPQVSICFVLDHSGSMQGKYLADAKRAIEESALSLDESVQVGLVAFESAATIECELTNPKNMVGFLDGIEATGGTSIASGLITGDEALQNALGKKVIILLSDGYDGDTNVLEPVLNQLKDDEIVVFTIGLVGCDEKYLGRIADATGGSFVSVSDTGRLTEIFEEIQKFLTKSYRITYDVVQSDIEERYVHIQKVGSFVQTMKKYSLLEEKEEEQRYYEESMSDYFRLFGTTSGGQ